MLEFKLLLKTQNAIIDSMYDGIYITDEAGITLYVNDSYTRISGIKREYVIGRHMSELIADGFFKDSASLKVLKSHKTVTMIDVFNNGKQCLITSSPVFDDSGKLIRVVTNVRDISELIELQKEIKIHDDMKNEYLKIIKNKEIKSEIIAKSKKMNEIIEVIQNISDVDATVLVYGETGVGKEVVVREIHRTSSRNNGPFVKVNCASIPDNLFESELFGYEKGAFTGALTSGKIGLFEVANNGTIFLDEIGDMPLYIQPKLLRVLQEMEIRPVGSRKSKKIDVRVIAATNLDLKERVAKGMFREDLYYRLNVIPIEIPPLRKRPDDIPFLIQHYINYFNSKYNKNKYVSIEAMEAFKAYIWPGNVRELINIIERLEVTTISNKISKEQVIQLVDINQKYEYNIDLEQNSYTLEEMLSRYERRILENALLEHKTTRKISRVLGISQATVVRKLNKYNINAD